MTAFLLLGLAALLLSVISVWFVRQLARRHGWVAPPRKDRWHKTPTALFGGAGIFLSFSTTGLIAFFLDPSLGHRLTLALFVGGLGSFLLGLFDDIYHLKPVSKIVGQIALVSFFVFTGGGFHVTQGPVLNTLLTYFWFLGIMNAVNLLDNMDGLASGVVAIAAMVLLVLMKLSGNPFGEPALRITFIFIMSILGFWFFNRSPATIFMGDTGSLFLGYTLAALAIPNSLSRYEAGVHYSSLLSLLIPVAVLAIPIFDTTLVTLARTFSGKTPLQGGRDHSSHRLVGLGFSQKTSVHILYLLTLTGGIAAILMATYHSISLVIFGLYATFLVIVGLYLAKRRVYPEETASDKKSGWTPLVGEVMYKKGMSEVLLDIVLVALSYFLACSLADDPQQRSQFFRASIPMVIVTTLVIFRISGIYKGLWSLLSVEDVAIFGRAVMIAVLASLGINHYLLALTANWNVYPAFGLLLFFAVVGSRLSFRFFDTLISSHSLAKRPIKILLYGAGTAGKMVVDEIKRNENYRDFRPIGFLDDDATKQGRSVSGIKILGNLEKLERMVRNTPPDFCEIWVSSFTIPEERIRRLTALLPKGVSIKRMRLCLDILAVAP